MPDQYELIPEPPQLKDYLRLRKIAGLSPFTEEAGRKGLAGTLAGVSILFENGVIGMGRVVGDGGCFFEIVDIAVDPAHQRRGLGRKIMTALMARVREIAPKSAYVSLIADLPADKLYEQFGFNPTAPSAIGMELKIS